MEILQDNCEGNCHLLEVTWQATLWDKFIPCTLLTALLVMTMWALCFFRKVFGDFARHSCTKCWIWTLPFKHFSKVTSLGVYFVGWWCLDLLFPLPCVLLVEAYNVELVLKLFSAPTEETLVWLLFYNGRKALDFYLLLLQRMWL